MENSFFKESYRRTNIDNLGDVFTGLEINRKYNVAQSELTQENCDDLEKIQELKIRVEKIKKFMDKFHKISPLICIQHVEFIKSKNFKQHVVDRFMEERNLSPLDVVYLDIDMIFKRAKSYYTNLEFNSFDVYYVSDVKEHERLFYLKHSK